MRYIDVVMISRETHGKEHTGRGGQATRTCRPTAARRQESAGSRAHGWGAATNGISLARGAESWWHRCAAQHEQRWATGAIGSGGIVAAVCGTTRGRRGAWLRHATVDAQAGSVVDRTRVRRAVQRGPRLAFARAVGAVQ